jgi:ribosomal protein S17E
MAFYSGVSLTGGNLQDKNIKKKIDHYFDKYFDTFRESAINTNVRLVNFDLNNPNNFYFS